MFHRRSLLAVLVTAITTATAAHAADVKIGASLLTQQHPFYVELANAMKAEAAKDHAQIDIAIANQDLSKQIADVQDFVTKKVDVIVISRAFVLKKEDADRYDQWRTQPRLEHLAGRCFYF